MVEVLVSYASGTSRMLETCLSALGRHDSGFAGGVRVVVLTGDSQAFEEAKNVAYDHGAACVQYDVSGVTTSSGRHAKMLDMAVLDTQAKHVLSLDSDCFPVADGWLAKIFAVGKDVSGILWPWVPPPAGLDMKTIEMRLRRQHCWNNTDRKSVV